MKGKIALIFLIGIFLLAVFSPYYEVVRANTLPWWTVQSIDTMKYSRDIAREKLTVADFDKTIEDQVSRIAQTGASHVAVGTPYDEEFVPFLNRWVQAARKYNLNVWFRGNFSGWERWFGYQRITRNEHLTKTKEFIEKHADLFADGDIFTPCPECENGGPGDPRNTRDTKGHREFLIKEYQITKDAFSKIGKQVKSNYASMNGDVARLIMDKDTTAAFDGLVTIDHYVATPEKLVGDIKEIARVSGGSVILGEFGVPIPDIHGKLDEKEQQKWLKQALTQLSVTKELVGLNYWTGFGASTALWNSDGSDRSAVSVLKSFYEPQILTGQVLTEFKKPVARAEVKSAFQDTNTDENGRFMIPTIADEEIEVSKIGYKPQKLKLNDQKRDVTVTLTPVSNNLLYKLFILIYRLINPL